MDLEERPVSLTELANDSALQFRFTLNDGGMLFSFWVSATEDGKSGGYVAAGGPAFKGARDSV